MKWVEVEKIEPSWEGWEHAAGSQIMLFHSTALSYNIDEKKNSFQPGPLSLAHSNCVCMGFLWVL